MKKMIPKIIHYCWFGDNEKPTLVKKCIESWKTHCPDYKIIEWNEHNYDILRHSYTKWCYENKKWAFLSDYARLEIVSQHGGIYLDTDVEMKRSFDSFLSFKAFFGFENESSIATGLGFGSEKQNTSVLAMLSIYDALAPSVDGSYPLSACPALNTAAIKKLGFCPNGSMQIIEDIAVFPPEYFNPLDDATGKLNVTENTYSIHWYAKSWLGKNIFLRSKFTRPFHRIFGKNCFVWIRRIGKRCIK